MALRATDISHSEHDVQTAAHVARTIAARGTHLASAPDRGTPSQATARHLAFSLSRLDPRDVLILKTTSTEQSNLRLSVSNRLKGSTLERTIGDLCGVRGVRLHEVPASTDSLTRLREFFADPALDGGLFPKWLLDELLHNTVLDTKLRDGILGCLRVVLPLSVRLPSPEQGVTLEFPQGSEIHNSPARMVRTSLSFGDVVWRGTDDGDSVAVSIERRPVSFPKAASRDVVWPPIQNDIDVFARVPLSPPCPPLTPTVGFIVSKAEALPTNWILPSSTVVLVPGTTTWRKLAQRNVWVHGSFDGLGEEEYDSLALSFPEVTRWIKLGHAEAIQSSDTDLLPTYRLESQGRAPQISPYTHFFWKSGSQFEYFLESNPSMRAAYHGSGPGHTHATIVRHLGASSRIGVFLGIDDFMEHVL